MSKVTQTTQAFLMIEPKYFIYVTSLSSLNLSLIMQSLNHLSSVFPHKRQNSQETDGTEQQS